MHFAAVCRIGEISAEAGYICISGELTAYVFGGVKAPFRRPLAAKIGIVAIILFDSELIALVLKDKGIYKVVYCLCESFVVRSNYYEPSAFKHLDDIFVFHALKKRESFGDLGTVSYVSDNDLVIIDYLV